MNQENQIDDKLKRRRELTLARVRKYREKKRNKTLQYDSMMQNKRNDKLSNKEKAKERSRRYRERKRLRALNLINHVIHDSPIPGPSHCDPPLLMSNQKKLQTVTDTLTNFISKRREISIYLSNCQNLRENAIEHDEIIVQRSNIVPSYKIWSNNEVGNIIVSNLHHVAKFKRPDYKAAGVTIFKHNKDTLNIISSDIDATFSNSLSYKFDKSSIGEIFIAKCETRNGQIIVMVAVYILPDQSMNKIIEFIHENLLIYTETGSALRKRKLHELPMILSGEFNVDFSNDKSEPLVDFLKSTLNLNKSNDPNENAINHETKIDVVYYRYLNRLKSKVFMSYSSFHQPIVSFLDYAENEESEVEEILPE